MRHCIHLLGIGLAGALGLALGLPAGASAAGDPPRQKAAAAVEYARGLLAEAHGRDEEAGGHFAEARRLDPEQDAAGVSAIDDRGLWEATVELGPASDSNPALLSDDLTVGRPDRATLLRGATADQGGQIAGRLGLYPRHRRLGDGLALTVELGRSFYRDLDFLDLGAVEGAVTWTRGSSPSGYLAGPLTAVRVPFGASRLTLLAQAGAGTAELGGTRYASSVEGGVSATLRESGRTATRLDLAVADRTFSGRGLADERQSGPEIALELSQQAFFGRFDRSLRLGLRGYDRQARPAFARTGWEGIAELAWAARPRLGAFLTAAAGRDTYGDRASNLFSAVGPARRDQTRRAAFALTWEASLRLHWVLRAAWAERRSNVDLGSGLPDLDYRRTTLSAGAVWRLR